MQSGARKSTDKSVCATKTCDRKSRDTIICAAKISGRLWFSAGGRIFIIELEDRAIAFMAYVSDFLVELHQRRMIASRDQECNPTFGGVSGAKGGMQRRPAALVNQLYADGLLPL